MRIKTFVAGGAVAAAFTFAAAGPAAAHISITEPEQEPGAYTVLGFSVPHGCDDAPTTKIEIQIPEPILDVTPTRNPFYEVSVETEELAEPVEGSHGESVTTRDAVVVYTADVPLPSDQRDVLELSLQIPEEAAGTTLYFPVIQTCGDVESAWIEIPDEGQDPHDLELPAPSVVVAAASSGGGHGDGSGQVSDEPVSDEEGAGEVAAPDSVTADSDDGTDAVAVIALVVGAAGLLVGAGAFLTARRRA